MSRDLPNATRTDGRQFLPVARPSTPAEPGPSVPALGSANLARRIQGVGELQYLLSAIDSTRSDALNAREIRKIILEQSYRARVGHIGSSLSVADIMAALYGKVIRLGTTDASDRDQFVLSKGHAALALYAALHLRGWISKAELNGFSGDGTLLGVHPQFEQRGVDFATGSLGQGFSMAIGAAMAAQWQKSKRRVFVLLSDAECNEGSVWEAAMLASHHQLANLVAIIDVNGQQALDYTHKVVDMQMLERWKSFGWDARTIDGHDADGLATVMQSLGGQGAPHVLLATTVSGKGVSFMEKRIEWHYLPMTSDQYSRAMMEVEQSL